MYESYARLNIELIKIATVIEKEFGLAHRKSQRTISRTL
jgi:hypothetical protein